MIDNMLISMQITFAPRVCVCVFGGFFLFAWLSHLPFSIIFFFCVCEGMHDLRISSFESKVCGGGPAAGLRKEKRQREKKNPKTR